MLEYLVAKTVQQDLDRSERDVNQRQEYYALKSIDRLERELGKARAHANVVVARAA